MSDSDTIPLTDELLDVMRRAGEIAQELREQFVSPKALLLALLDEPQIGPGIERVVSRQKVVEADVENRFNNVRTVEEFLRGEHPAMIRFDTLCFKTRDGSASMWLSKDALAIFLEGAKRARGRYYPHDLALGLAAEARLAPGILAAIRVEPGVFSDAVPAMRNA